MATGWTVRCSSTVGGKRFSVLHFRRYRPWGPTRFFYNGYRLSFLRAKWLGRGVNHPSLPSAEVNYEWSHTSTPPFVLDISCYGDVFNLENFILDTESKDDNVLGSSVSTVTLLGICGYGTIRSRTWIPPPPSSSRLD